MEIVKRFVHHEFASSRSEESFKDKAWWIWGAGDNGELYYMGHISGMPEVTEWAPQMYLLISMTDDEYKRITNQFGWRCML